MGTVWLAVRSLAWTILVPGTVAGYVPWRFFGLGQARLDLRSPAHAVGLLAASAGAALLLACIWEFASSGRGTLAPVDPPRELVVRGPYRTVRNPMYLSVTTILAGELLLAFSGAFLAYAIVWLIAVNLFVMAHEEPSLRVRFGDSYVRYCQRVGRWWPRVRRGETRD